MPLTTNIIAPAGLQNTQISVSREDEPRSPSDLRPNVPGCLSSEPHLGLLWQRYFPARDRRSLRAVNGDPEDATEDVNGLELWKGYGSVRWFVHVDEQIHRRVQRTASAYDRMIDHLHSRREQYAGVLQQARRYALKAQSRILPGMGNPAAVENSGLAFHATYGFPIVPGSSLKGLARHFLEEEFDLEAADEIEELRVLLSGSTGESRDLSSYIFGDGGEEGAEGLLIFQDAWPRLPTGGRGWFDVEVLTVHQQHYYGLGEDVIPDDTADPNPNYFLALRPEVSFVFLLGSSAQAQSQLAGEVRLQLLGFTSKLLAEALDRWGIGGKTGAGYGRMELTDLPGGQG